MYVGFAMGTSGSPFPENKNSSSSSTVPRGPRGTKSPLSYVEIENFCAQKHLAEELINLLLTFDYYSSKRQGSPRKEISFPTTPRNKKYIPHDLVRNCKPYMY